MMNASTSLDHRRSRRHSLSRSAEPAADHPDSLADEYRRVRSFTEQLCAPLHTEDFVVQSAPEVSPTKWHLAHTSWFFETFVLARFCDDYVPVDTDYRVLFNSYYNAVGSQFPKAHRGTLSRPTVEEVFGYRRRVDDAMTELLSIQPTSRGTALSELVTIGLHHEQQHQELILTDIKHVLGSNPQAPPYRDGLRADSDRSAPPVAWCHFDGGLCDVGHDGTGRFAYDNEGPRHRVYLEPFAIASRLVTNGEYLEFMNAGGYERSAHWLSDGWRIKGEQRWIAPLYWIQQDGQWMHYTLGGVRPINPNEPVCHVSAYEANAYANWAGVRLPTEFEWETACPADIDDGNFAERERFHPGVAPAEAHGSRPAQMFGDVWEWTASAYLPYPGYRAAEGALGEYNGKFMCNQMVLRGGSCATPQSHVRRTYRNFFPPEARWQFTGLRLARMP